MKKLVLLAVLLFFASAPLGSSLTRFDGPGPVCQPDDPICLPPPA